MPTALAPLGEARLESRNEGGAEGVYDQLALVFGGLLWTFTSV